MSVIETERVTTTQLLAMPDDDTDRELIRGQLRERPRTKRNRFHTFAVGRIARLLDVWLDSQPEPRAEVHAGDVGTILRRDPDTTVGIDVALFAADVIAAQTDQTTLIDGVPVLAVEVLSPSDKHEEIREKVLEYLAMGVKLIWIVDPYFQTVQVHRSGSEPQMFNRDQTLQAEDVLPGLSIAVADLFGPAAS